jgi:TRAP-type C4-dicarboxylate transport system substrate-binding protein
MSATEIKAAITANLDKMDESLLKAIHALTQTYIQELEEAALEAEIMSIPPDPSLRQLTVEEMEERLAKSEAQFETGEYMTLEELRKESETW